MSERVTVSCPNCAARFKVDPAGLGRRGKCRECGEVFSLTAAPPRAATAPPARQPAASSQQPAAARAKSAAAKPPVKAAAPVVAAAAVAPKPRQPAAAPLRPAPAEPDTYDVYGDADLAAPPPLPAARASTGGGRFGAAGRATAQAVPGKASWRDAKAKSSDSPSMWKRVGGGIATLFFVVAIVGKIVRTYNRATADSDAPSARADGGGTSSGSASAAQDPPRRTGPFPAVPPIAFAPVAGGQLGTVEFVGRHAARTNVRLFLPPGTHADGSLPCVFVCPAGSNLLVGVPFGADEHEDFLPMLDAGMAVCFYTLDGTVDDLQTMTDSDFERAAVAYRRSDGGMANLADAIDAVVGAAPMVDPSRLGTCGHSSAGTVALMATAREPRVRAAAVMAPAVDVVGWLGDELMQAITDPQETRFLHAASPAEIPTLSRPVYIYQCRDDDNTPVAAASRFAGKHQDNVTLELADVGGHVGAYHQGKGNAFAFLAKTLGARQ